MNSDANKQSGRWLPPSLLVLLAATVLLRWATFSGLSLGDDMIYVRQVSQHFFSSQWPPDANHWATRLVMTQPPVLLASLVGWSKWILFVIPFGSSVLKVALTYWFAKKFVNQKVAVIAGMIACCFPGDVIFSTHFFPDVVVGFLGGAAILFWLAFLELDKLRYAWLTGISLFLAYFTRETIVLDAPVYLALILAYRKWPMKGILVVLLSLVMALLLEGILYSVTAGDPLFRVHAVLSQQANPRNLELIDTATAGGNFWTDPLLLVVTSHELGIVLLAALCIATYVLSKRVLGDDSTSGLMLAIALWVLIGFVWMMYGSTVPHKWVPLHRDPRYLLSLVCPAAILLGWWLTQLSVTLRWLCLIALLGTSVFACTLDQAPYMTSAHRKFVQSGTSERVAIEPLDFLGVWWESGFDESPQFDCLAGGRRSTWESLPGLTKVDLEDADRILLSPKYSRDLQKRARELGFREVDRYESDVSLGRRAIGALLLRLPSQKKRAEQILAGTPIILMERQR